MGRSPGGVVAVGRLSGEALAAWVTESCAEQGVPVKVTDPVVVARVGVLLTGRGPSGPQAERGPDGTGRSELPDRHDSGRVEAVAGIGAGSDHGVVEDGGDDGALSVEGQSGPLVA